MGSLMVKCEQKRTDCNNYTIHGRCMALVDTRFSKPCPFYCSVKDTNPSDKIYHVISFRDIPDIR